MARGDHLLASRAGYHHDGIDLGDGRVVHFAAGPGQCKAQASVRIDTSETFRGDGTVAVRQYASAPDPAEVVERALSRLDATGYDLGFNNCEHFACWCVTGEHRSEQVVQLAATGGMAVTTGAAAAIGVDVVASAGIVTGLSGPGMMSGLAATGGLLGGGAILGTVMLATIPGAAGALIMNRALRDDPQLPEPQRQARTAGRAGAVAGAGAGVLGGAWAIAAAGSVAGFSAAGITSGLAAIGATFGGGMAYGLMAVLAAPGLLAALVGLGLYWMVRWLNAPPAPQPASA